eukprot:symbB.v1.2.020420.t1/scaffold1653.1/size107518/1
MSYKGDHCRLVQTSRLATPRLKETPRPVRGAKALQDLKGLEQQTRSSSPEGRDFSEEVLAAAEKWPVDEDGINPDLDPGTVGLNLGLDAKDRFYGRMSGIEVEKELIRMAVLLQSLLRDFALMKDTFGHLQDEQISLKDVVVQHQIASTDQKVELQKDLEEKMKWVDSQVNESNWIVAKCHKDTAAKAQVLREELDGKLELHKLLFEDFRAEAGKRMDHASNALEEMQHHLVERIQCNEQARKALRMDVFNILVQDRQAVQDLRRSDQEQTNKKFAAIEAVQEAMKEAASLMDGKMDSTLEALKDVEEKVLMVSEENVSKFVLTENVVTEVQQKVHEISEETGRRRLATQVVIDDLRKELHVLKKAHVAGSLSEYSRDDSQGGRLLQEDFQGSHVSVVSASHGSELEITLTQSSTSLQERCDLLEIQVQKAAENQKILEDEIFERLKTLEFQVSEPTDVPTPKWTEVVEQLNYFDHQVHLAAQSQRALAEDVFQRFEDLEQVQHTALTKDVLEALENLELQVLERGQKQEDLENEIHDLQVQLGLMQQREQSKDEESLDERRPSGRS